MKKNILIAVGIVLVLVVGCLIYKSLKAPALVTEPYVLTKPIVSEQPSASVISEPVTVEESEDALDSIETEEADVDSDFEDLESLDF